MWIPKWSRQTDLSRTTPPPNDDDHQTIKTHQLASHPLQHHSGKGQKKLMETMALDRAMFDPKADNLSSSDIQSKRHQLNMFFLSFFSFLSSLFLPFYFSFLSVRPSVCLPVSLSFFLFCFLPCCCNCCCGCFRCYPVFLSFFLFSFVLLSVLVN